MRRWNEEYASKNNFLISKSKKKAAQELRHLKANIQDGKNWKREKVHVQFLRYKYKNWCPKHKRLYVEVEKH